jgi:hypothetical protein
VLDYFSLQWDVPFVVSRFPFSLSLSLSLSLFLSPPYVMVNLICVLHIILGGDATFAPTTFAPKHLPIRAFAQKGICPEDNCPEYN